MTDRDLIAAACERADFCAEVFRPGTTEAIFRIDQVKALADAYRAQQARIAELEARIETLCDPSIQAMVGLIEGSFVPVEELAAVRMERDALREALKALTTQWRAKKSSVDSYHATMGIGWGACADELSALASAAGAEEPPKTEEPT